MTVGEAIEALSRFDRTDKLTVFVPKEQWGNNCFIEEIKKTDCRKVSIKVSDE